MVVVDRLSKYGHFIPLKTYYTAKQVAKAFFANVAKLHGVPKSIVSDRDKVFTSQFRQQPFKLQGTTLAPCPQLTTLKRMANPKPLTSV